MNNLERLTFYYLAGRLFIPLPRYLIYNPTLRCDLACRHCGIWEAEKQKELAPVDLKKIIQRKFFRKIDTAWLTGGEPSMRKDLKELAAVFRDSLPGMRVLGIASNGFATERILARLEEILSELDPTRQGLFVHLSLDGIGEVEDRIRGRVGAFAALSETVKGINGLKKRYPARKIELGFNCVIQKQNVDQLEEIRKFAQDQGSSLTFNMVEITDQYYCNQDRAGELALDQAEKEQVIIFLKRLIPQSGAALSYQYRRMLAVLSGQKRDRRCLSLYSTLAIDADGSWIPCPLCSEWKRVNFISDPPEIFWKSKEAMELRQRVERELCPECMLSCSLGDSLSVPEFLRGGF